MEAFRGLFEMLAWAGSIGDRFIADGVFRPALLDGLYYIRNVVLHQGVDVLFWLFRPPSMLGTMRQGPTTPVVDVWVWPLPGDFEPPRSLAGEKEYESLLAGHEVVPTLENALAVLRRDLGT